VSQEFPPETGWGGIGTYADVLSEALAAKGHEVHVLSAVEGQAETHVRSGAVTVHRFPLRRVRGAGRVTRSPETWKRLWSARSVAALVPRLGFRPDVVECPEWQAEGLFLGRRGSPPLVVRLHSAAWQLFPFTGQGTGLLGLDGRMAARLEDASARRARVVISTRANLAEALPRLGIDERVTHAIPYPVRLPAPAPIPATGPPRITFVGRLEPRKGPEVLVRAAPAVLAEVPDARFAFVGRDGIEPGAPSSAAWLEAEAERLGVRDAIELLGPREPAGVVEELARSSLCAFPSRWESFGNVVAEASAVGRPVVVSDIPPFRELVLDGRSGHVVPLDDTGAWARAIVELLADREAAAAMGEAGAEHVSRLSDPARVADLTLAAYEQALAR
jgi:glycogen(starch) synthase